MIIWLDDAPEAYWATNCSGLVGEDGTGHSGVGTGSGSGSGHGSHTTGGVSGSGGITPTTEGGGFTPTTEGGGFTGGGTTGAGVGLTTGAGGGVGLGGWEFLYAVSVGTSHSPVAFNPRDFWNATIALYVNWPL